jgi:hypothetical protein
MSSRSPRVPEFTKIGLGIASPPHMDEVVGLQIFFTYFIWFTHSQRLSYIIHQSTQFGLRLCLPRVSATWYTCVGVTQNPQFWSEIRRFQLKCFAIYRNPSVSSPIARLIMMHISANERLGDGTIWGVKLLKISLKGKKSQIEQPIENVI